MNPGHSWNGTEWVKYVPNQTYHEGQYIPQISTDLSTHFGNYIQLDRESMYKWGSQLKEQLLAEPIRFQI